LLRREDTIQPDTFDNFPITIGQPPDAVLAKSEKRGEKRRLT
jgi:hypothetical protein